MINSPDELLKRISQTLVFYNGDMIGGFEAVKTIRDLIADYRLPDISVSGDSDTIDAYHATRRRSGLKWGKVIPANAETFAMFRAARGIEGLAKYAYKLHLKWLKEQETAYTPAKLG